ncbi:response regulator transcription factor [Cupriavidus taiwanensis]|uniref:DNA-binding response regulator in two-component regulatory system wtih UhpB n=1 Tax=Cupriavidus taiwanensis TaxID=164546 RepID=A0A375GY26_9BURK|nr:response regulator transcription factor [Cupriavidus taiwanensis]SOY39519.1 putative response regulator, LuxR family [Cupriavidus taiwanensis]SOY42334.1 putative response regulator, LuxR family [Cupriavidus taiwanensis]SOY78928.1 putative response regulator, LuxR family [Cupriavidus taiwanensis]SOZ20696.1 putative response regulator, LuxR family [Cupriavidus taiwanensis]SOZ60985.1 putative response regulator, LuxR family [Cupriavidus taiwanensis]
MIQFLAEDSADHEAPARVLLIDDHALVRDGMRMHLALQPGLRVVGEADDGEAALAWLDRAGVAEIPDLVITDIGMRGMGGIALAAALHDRYPELAVLIVSMHDNLEYVRQAVRAGARGYVLKDAPADELIAAIRAVLAGRVFYSARIARGIAEQSPAAGPLDALTPRERDILRGIGRGLANKEIAAQLGVSVRTVETHRLNLKRKLGIEGRAGLVKYAVETLGDSEGG